MNGPGEGFVFTAGSAGHSKALKGIYTLDCPSITGLL